MSKPAFRYPMPDGVTSLKDFVKAGNARKAIDDQGGHREHVHRTLSQTGSEEAAIKRSLASDYDAKKIERTALEVELRELKEKFAAAQRRGAATGKYLPIAEYEEMRFNINRIITKIRNLQETMGAMKAEMKRKLKPFEGWFMECAKVMLDSDVYEAIHQAAYEKVRREKILANGGSTDKEPT